MQRSVQHSLPNCHQLHADPLDHGNATPQEASAAGTRQTQHIPSLTTAAQQAGALLQLPCQQHQYHAALLKLESCSCCCSSAIMLLIVLLPLLLLLAAFAVLHAPSKCPTGPSNSSITRRR
jgi:hypothetical protein